MTHDLEALIQHGDLAMMTQIVGSYLTKIIAHILQQIDIDALTW
jgi:hypothetical protein